MPIKIISTFTHIRRITPKTWSSCKQQTLGMKGTGFSLGIVFLEEVKCKYICMVSMSSKIFSTLKRGHHPLILNFSNDIYICNMKFGWISVLCR